jgi:hypothetical protein
VFLLDSLILPSSFYLFSTEGKYGTNLWPTSSTTAGDRLQAHWFSPHDELDGILSARVVKDLLAS